MLARVGRESTATSRGGFYSPRGIAVDSRGRPVRSRVAWTDYGRTLDPPRELPIDAELVRGAGLEVWLQGAPSKEFVPSSFESASRFGPRVAGCPGTWEAGRYQGIAA